MTNSVQPKKRIISAIAQACCYSLLVSPISVISLVHAGPVGGDVVGGSGAITQSGANTTVNQTTQNMAINWQSYNVNTDERVQYIQPNASSISLNRILSNNGSTIAGRIDANGQVILVNPNGVFFTPTSVINVGGIIASGLDIQPTDFMNGNYIFNEVLGADGAVIHSGIINASLGGNVALIGRHVENNGLISASLGTVTLAAGKQAVLTFDNGGVLGVRVSQEILQSELGVDPAVMNSGAIQAQGGRVLLTASVSQDVFSRAVNTNGINPATSVVVHADGSFTLGGGADVVNSGTINTSTTSADQNVGRIVLVGENVTSSGTIKADAASGNGGEIELHARDTMLLTQNSVTSARSEANGNGGIIKVLGDKVGLFDQSTVDVSGSNGGGQVLIGGDREGKNTSVRNANFIYLSQQSRVNADALDNGNGGKIITFAMDTARIYGGLFARGGVNGGNGGFIETSGLYGFEITTVPDVSAVAGKGGEWLIDPYNLLITNVDNDTGCSNINSLTSGCHIGNNNSPFLTSPFTATGNNAVLDMNMIRRGLGNGDVIINTTPSPAAGAQLGDITFEASADINYDGHGVRTLTLNAAHNITFQAGSRIYDADPANGSDLLNVSLNAGGTVQLDPAIGTQGQQGFIDAASITTQGGNFNVGSMNTRVASFTNNGTVSTSAVLTETGVVGGDVSIYATGAIYTSGLVTTGAEGAGSTSGSRGGSVVLNTNGGNSMITLTSLLNTSGGRDISGGNETGGNAGMVSFIAPGGILLFGNITAASGALSSTPPNNGTQTLGNGANITLTGRVAVGADVSINASGNTAGNIEFTAAVDSENITSRSLIVVGKNIKFTSNVGATNSLAALNIFATGDVSIPVASSITANTLTVARSLSSPATTYANSFTSGIINTSVTNGNIAIRATDIVVGALQSGTGAITLAASGVLNNTSSITLNGNVDLGNNTANLTLFTLSTADTASTTINYIGDFTSNINITGSSGVDTLTAANRANNWAITGANSGSLNRNLTTLPGITFSSVENLSGNAGVDNFLLANNLGSLRGLINGGAGIGSDTLTIDTLVTTPPAIKLVAAVPTPQVSNPTNTLTLFQVETVTNNSPAAGTVTGPDVAGTRWEINGDINSTTASTVTWTGNLVTPDVSFTRFNVINGGTLADTFNINSTYTGTLHGGLGADTFNINNIGLQITSINGGGDVGDTLVAANEANYWLVDLTNGGKIYSQALTRDVSGTPVPAANSLRVTFMGIQNITGNANIDNFIAGAGSTMNGLIDGGAGVLDVLDLLGYGAVAIDLSNTSRGNFNVTQVETITAATGVSSTLYGANVASNWTINSANGGNIAPVSLPTAANTVAFLGFNHLVGGNQTDKFTMDASAVPPGSILGAGSLIDGGDIISGDIATYNTLVARQGVLNTWSFTIADSGTLADAGGIPYVSNFTRIQNFTGGGLNDLADVSSLGTVNVASYVGFFGIIGNNTNNILVGTTGGDTWVIGVVPNYVNALNDGTNDGTVTFGTNTLRFINIPTLRAGAGTNTFTIDSGNALGVPPVPGGSIASIDGTSGTNTLTGRNGLNTWSITGTNTGSVNVTATVGTPYASFNGIQTLRGGSSDDVFVYSGVNTTASSVNSINGNGGMNTVDLSALTSTLLVALNTGAFSDIQRYIGNGASSTFRGPDQTNNWNIGTVAGFTDTVIPNRNNGINDGKLNEGTPGEIQFIDFANLTGGNAADTFVYQAGSSVMGVVSGGTVSTGIIDTVDISAFTTNANVDLRGTSFTNIQRFIGNGSNSTFTSTNSANTWVIGQIASYSDTVKNNGTNDGILTPATAAAIQFIDFITLNGGTGADTFRFSPFARITGTLNGGDAANINYIDYSLYNTTNIPNLTNISVSALTPNIVDVMVVGSNVPARTTVALTINNIQGVIGNNSSSTLIGSVVGSNWDIRDVTSSDGRSSNGTNDGIVTSTGGASVLTFVDFNNLTGSGTNVDIITINDTGSITGLFDGVGGADILTARNVANFWTIKAPADMSSISTNPSGTQPYVTFSNIQRLVGGSVNDTFGFTVTPTASGITSVNGGTLVAGITNEVNVSQVLGNVDVPLSLFSNVNQYVGNNIGTVAGSTNNSTLMGTNAATIWNINNRNSGCINSGSNTSCIGAPVLFSNFNNLTGGTGTNTFNLNNITGTSAGSLSGLLTGGGAASLNANTTSITSVQVYDTLPPTQVFNSPGAIAVFNMGGTTTGNYVTACTGVCVYTIDGFNTYLLLGTRYNSAIINASSGNDTFNWISGYLNGYINGGGGDDRLVITNPANSTIVLGGTTGGPGVLSVQNVQTIIANNSNATSYTNTLIGPNPITLTNTNIWDIHSVSIAGIPTGVYPANSGTVTTAGSIVTFANFNNLTGGTGRDDFTLTTGGSLQGLLNGGGGIDSLLIANQSIMTVQLADAISLPQVVNAANTLTVFQIGTLTGNTVGTDRLIGANAPLNIWTLNGANSGSVNDGTSPITRFSNFADLTGGTGNDRFDIARDITAPTITQQFNGTIHTNGGADTLNVYLSGLETGVAVVNFITDAGSTGSVHIQNATAGNSGAYTGLYSTGVMVGNILGDQFDYTNGTNQYTVKYTGAQTIQDSVTATSLTVNGSGTIALSVPASAGFNAAFRVNAATAVDVAGKTNLILNGVGSADTIALNTTTDITLPTSSILTLSAETVTQTTGRLLVGSLVLNNIGPSQLSIDANNLSVNNNSGNLVINELNTLELGGIANSTFSTTGSIDITAGGSVTSASTTPLTSSGAFRITTPGNIFLIGANNLSGALTFTGPPRAADVILNNTVATNIAGINATNLTVTAGGDITDSDVITVTGTTRLDAGANNISLDNGNDFNVVNVVNANSLVLNDIDNIAASSGSDIGITASSITLTTVTGVGDTASQLRTQTATLDVINTTGGAVNISNTGTLLVRNLQNQGDITLTNTGGVMTINEINANYSRDYNNITVPYAGSVYLNSNNSIFGFGPARYNSPPPDIVAESLTVNIPNTQSFGTIPRPISLRIRTAFVSSTQLGGVFYFNGRPPISPEGLPEFTGIEGIGSQQLIGVESLAGVDPAIFTEVRNYFYEDLAIKMPPDQQYAEDDEKEKKRHLNKVQEAQ